jgi:hypothetical protein
MSIGFSPARACDAAGEFALYVAASAHVSPLTNAAKGKLEGGFSTWPTTTSACRLAFMDTMRVCVIAISFR